MRISMGDSVLMKVLSEIDSSSLLVCIFSLEKVSTTSSSDFETTKLLNMRIGYMSEIWGIG